MPVPEKARERLQGARFQWATENIARGKRFHGIRFKKYDQEKSGDATGTLGPAKFCRLHFITQKNP
jgi:hypothetical protein